jgi:hypothetical protein
VESERLKLGGTGEERDVRSLLASRVVCGTDPRAPVDGASVVKLYEPCQDETYPGDWLGARQRHRLERIVLHTLRLQAILKRRLELSQLFFCLGGQNLPVCVMTGKRANGRQVGFWLNLLVLRTKANGMVRLRW